MADKILVTYQDLQNAATQYARSAEAIHEQIVAMGNLNKNLASAWQNDTASAFYERWDREYKPDLDSAVTALQSISEFITKYAQKQAEFDSETASSIRNG